MSKEYPQDWSVRDILDSFRRGKRDNFSKGGLSSFQYMSSVGGYGTGEEYLLDTPALWFINAPNIQVAYNRLEAALKEFFAHKYSRCLYDIGIDPDEFTRIALRNLRSEKSWAESLEGDLEDTFEVTTYEWHNKYVYLWLTG